MKRDSLERRAWVGNPKSGAPSRPGTPAGRETTRREAAPRSASSDGSAAESQLGSHPRPPRIRGSQAPASAPHFPESRSTSERSERWSERWSSDEAAEFLLSSQLVLSPSSPESPRPAPCKPRPPSLIDLVLFLSFRSGFLNPFRIRSFVCEIYYRTPDES